MAEVELALAASARGWSDKLHRFLADHGGARVRLVALSPDDVISEAYDILVIDDVCSFLTPRLVDLVRRSGRSVLGVFDSLDGADAKRRLLDCGVEDVIESGADPDEFLAAVVRIRTLAPAMAVLDPMVPEPDGRGAIIAVGAPPGGCGATEVSVALAENLGAVLVDADDVAPSVAHRLSLTLHPNIRTAIDRVHHHSGSLAGAFHSVGGLRLIAGLASGDDWSQLQPADVEAVIDELSLDHDRTVINIGSGLERPDVGEGRFGLARAIVAMADRVVGVGAPNPVGMARLIRWFREARVLAPDAVMVAVINNVGRSTFQRAELSRELAGAVDVSAVRVVPSDPRVSEAAWSGSLVGRGPFKKAVARVAEVLV